MVSWQIVRQAGGVLRRLWLDTRKCASSFGLDSTHGLAVEVEEVVGETETRLHRKFTHRKAWADGEIKIIAVLHQPSGSLQVRVDIPAGVLFKCPGHFSARHHSGTPLTQSVNVTTAPPCSVAATAFAKRVSAVTSVAPIRCPSAR